MTLSDCVLSIYNDLLDAGWRMQEIDNMDMIGFFHVRAWGSRKNKEESKVYIDDVWSNLTP